MIPVPTNMPTSSPIQPSLVRVEDGVEITNPELIMLRNNKIGGYNYRWRRQQQWTENYTLYRDTVTVNRLTQRQSVNLPVMKTALRTLLTGVDNMPVMFFENLDNDKQAETFENEYWKLTLDQNKAEIKDVQDKRQMFFFGRTFDQFQIIDGKVVMTIVDPEDIFVSRYVDPADLNTSRFLIHTHIFVPLSSLASNPDYDQDAVKRLQTWYASKLGIIRSQTNVNSLMLKNQKMAELGQFDVNSPILGETYVELSLHFVYRPTEDTSANSGNTTGDEQIFLYVECDQMEILMKKPLEEVIGVTKDHYWKNHFPYHTWADDVDKQDFWTDGVADIVRTPNKVLNAWYSQLVENRTLRNFGMTYYDGTKEGFVPQTWEPIPFGFYGLPGKPADIIQPVTIPALEDELEDMNFVMEMVEKATGATATQQGVQTERTITLGEVQLALQQAQERVRGMAKFYTQVWKDRALTFQKLVEAAPDKLDAVTIYKQGRNTTDVYPMEIQPNDWLTKSGSRVKIWDQNDKDNQDTTQLEKISAARANMPDNPKLLEIYQRKLLEFSGLKPDEISNIMSYEQQKMDQASQNPMGIGGMATTMPQPGSAGSPLTPQAPQAMPQPGMGGGGALPAQV